MQALEGSAQKSWEKVTLEGGIEPRGLSLRVGYSGASADSITTYIPQVTAGVSGRGGGVAWECSHQLTEKTLA